MPLLWHDGQLRRTRDGAEPAVPLPLPPGEVDAGAELAPAAPPLVVNAKDGSVLVYVPAGEFEMGDGQDSDCPKHRVYLDPYYIGVYCVTNRQYAQFIGEMGHRPPSNAFWQSAAKADHPVTHVSWDDALVYARWARLALPSEAQWEKAARGPANTSYPWGDEWDQSRCRNTANRATDTTAAVYAYPSGVSGYATYQQSGNVWEWCADWYGGHYYKTSPLSNPQGPTRGSLRVLRGGRWAGDGADHYRAAKRHELPATNRLDSLGFRLVRAAVLDPLAF